MAATALFFKHKRAAVCEVPLQFFGRRNRYCPQASSSPESGEIFVARYVPFYAFCGEKHRYAALNFKDARFCHAYNACAAVVQPYHAKINGACGRFRACGARLAHRNRDVAVKPMVYVGHHFAENRSVGRCVPYLPAADVVVYHFVDYHIVPLAFREVETAAETQRKVIFSFSAQQFPLSLVARDAHKRPRAAQLYWQRRKLGVENCGVVFTEFLLYIFYGRYHWSWAGYGETNKGAPQCVLFCGLPANRLAYAVMRVTSIVF